jgi:hypothetical protein
MSTNSLTRSTATGRRRISAVAVASVLLAGCASEGPTDTPTNTSSCGDANGSVITHSSNIATDETWAGDGVTHRIPNSISITGSASVTIAPCAIVELGPGVSITVRDSARLFAAGTGNTRSVTFRRSVADQAWGALQGYSPTSLIDLKFTRLQGGGALGARSDPTISVSGTGYGSPTATVLRTDNVTIESSKGAGVHLDANGAFTDDSDGLTITGSGGRPVHTTMMALGSLPAGAYIGNGTDEILVHGPNANVFGDMTVEDRGVPIRLPFGNMVIGPAPPSTAPVTLTLRPGVVLKFPRLGGEPTARLTFGSNGNAPNNVVGVLNAVGTAARPIVFTSGNEPDLTATNSFENNARCRQTYNGVLPPGTCSPAGGCTAP